MAAHRRGVTTRRDAMKGLAAALAGSALADRATLAAEPSASGAGVLSSRAALGQVYPIWKLSRPKPALPYSYFWTWDHSTNWMLDDPGVLNFGCGNRYLKRPETYIEDYRRLTDMAAGLGIKGIIIWGFLRDAHGGIESAKRVADYAASKGIAIKPGLGTNWYGGVYYEGEHPYNIETFVRKNPDARILDENGKPQDGGVCPTHPAFVNWLQEGVRWLFREFSVGGANLENGDFVVCHCPRCREQRAQAPKDEPEFWWHQYLGYNPALRAIEGQLKDKFVTWATYKGFVPGSGQTLKHAYMECQRPAVVDRLPADGLCQWTLSSMVRQKALPLTTFLDKGVPEEALSSEGWPADVKPPTKRSVGFIHQGSQWSHVPRYVNIVSTIKEGCLRAYRAGLEGVSIHGEVSSMHVPWALSYLAFSHFVHWPEDTLRQWGRKTLAQVLGSEDEGEAFAELFAHWDAGDLTDEQKNDLRRRANSLRNQVAAGKDLGRWRFWYWLSAVIAGQQDRQTASPF
ncbi:MAG: hypothetical protein HY718_02980 [Planctomycetes bacterium]|nr:hypothetical protein [Planctomycetota bacterium]